MSGNNAIIPSMMTKDKRNNFLWNTLGAGLNAFHSPLFLMVVSRVLGMRDAGYFSLAFTTGVLLSNVGLFGVRSYQITDVQNEHADGVYLNTRIVTSVMMTIAVLLYSLTKADAGTLFLIVLLQGLWRVPEVMADVMHGTLQMNGRLDLAGKSLLIRASLCIAAFITSMYVTKNLVISCFSLVLVNTLVFFAYDIHNYRKIIRNHRFALDREVKALLNSCLPLFLISLIYAYLINAPRYSIDSFGTPEIQTLYSIIVLPASMIWALFILVLNPLLPHLAKLYFSGKHKEFLKYIEMMTAGIVAFSVLYLVLMYVGGIRLFEIVYKVPLMEYRFEFMLAGAASCFLCIATVFSNLLIVIRRKRLLLISYIATALFALGSSIRFVIRAGLSGALWSYLITMILLMIILAFGFAMADRSRKEDREDGSEAGVE